MSKTELAIVEADLNELAKIATENTIAKLAEKYMNLVVLGEGDTEGYQEIKDGAIVVRDLRIAVDNRRKELKAGHLAAGNAVQKSANALRDLLEPIESHLKNEKAKIDEIKKVAKELKARMKAMPARVQTMMDVGFKMEEKICLALTDDDFDRFVLDLREERAEKKRIEQEARQKVIDDAEAKIKRNKELAEAEELGKSKAREDAASEKQRLIDESAESKRRAERAEKDRVAADKKAEEDRVARDARAEKDKVAREKKVEADRVVAEEKAKADKLQAIEDARVKAEADAETRRLVDESNAKAETDRLDAVAAARPDVEKLEAMANDILFFATPDVSTPRAQEIVDNATAAFEKIAEKIRAAAEGLK